MTVFQLYIGTVVVLGMNLLTLASMTAITRTVANVVVNPEDVVLNKEATVVYEDGNDHTERYRRAHRNALENIPLFLLTGYLLTLTDVSFGVAAGVFGAYTLARLSHSACYRFSLQPFRTASFGIGIVTQVVLLGLVAFKAFAG